MFAYLPFIEPSANLGILFPPPHHVCLAAVFLDQPVNVIHASATARGALNTEHVELALDVTKDEISPLTSHDADIITCAVTMPRFSEDFYMAKQPTQIRRKLVGSMRKLGTRSTSSRASP
jgi:hypothetical protein